MDSRTEQVNAGGSDKVLLMDAGHWLIDEASDKVIHAIVEF